MERTLAVGATGGSISALILRLLTSLVTEPLPPFECPACPLCFDHWQFEQLDLPSVLCGLLLGLLLGPCLDLIQLLRQSWKVWLQTRLRALDVPPGQQPALYKLA